MKKIFKKKIKPLLIDDLFIAGGSILIDKIKVTCIKDIHLFYRVLDDYLLDSGLSLDFGFEEMDFLVIEKMVRQFNEEEAMIILNCLNKMIEK